MLLSLFWKIYWVISVCLFTLAFVDNLATVTAENCPFALAFTETFLESFSKAVNVLSVYLGPDLHIMVRKNELFFIGWENNGIVDLSGYLEVERRWGVFEIDSREIDGETERW